MAEYQPTMQLIDTFWRSRGRFLTCGFLLEDGSGTLFFAETWGDTVGRKCAIRECDLEEWEALKANP
jgi:hypothetical protein